MGVGDVDYHQFFPIMQSAVKSQAGISDGFRPGTHPMANEKTPERTRSGVDLGTDGLVAGLLHGNLVLRFQIPNDDEQLLRHRFVRLDRQHFLQLRFAMLEVAEHQVVVSQQKVLGH